MRHPPVDWRAVVTACGYSDALCEGVRPSVKCRLGCAGIFVYIRPSRDGYTVYKHTAFEEIALAPGALPADAVRAGVAEIERRLEAEHARHAIQAEWYRDQIIMLKPPPPAVEVVS